MVERQREDVDIGCLLDQQPAQHLAAGEVEVERDELGKRGFDPVGVAEGDVPPVEPDAGEHGLHHLAVDLMDCGAEDLVAVHDPLHGTPERVRVERSLQVEHERLGIGRVRRTGLLEQPQPALARSRRVRAPARHRLDGGQAGRRLPRDPREQLGHR